MKDEDLRSSCFASLAVLCAQFGEDVPYRGGLDRGFPFRGVRVPFMSAQKGIFRARAQSGPGALSINTSSRSPYDDQEVDGGFLYAYRTGAIDQPDNRALRSASKLGVPLIYFVATRPGWYKPIFPAFVTEDDPTNRRVVVTPGEMRGPLDEREPVLPDDLIERRYALRTTRVRIHQARFRGQVLPAYANQCAICRLKETRLLDAAHIIGDLEEGGDPAVPNALCLCSIHHRAFDQDLIGVSPELQVHVSRRLLDEEDGPMLDALKASDGRLISVPKRRAWQPDPKRLALRFERFAAA